MLMKIAIDKARRLFGMGLLSKAIGASPQATKSGGSGLKTSMDMITSRITF